MYVRERASLRLWSDWLYLLRPPPALISLFPPPPVKSNQSGWRPVRPPAGVAYLVGCLAIQVNASLAM